MRPTLGFAWWVIGSKGRFEGRHVHSKEHRFEELSRGVRGDAFTCKGHPYIVSEGPVSEYLNN